MPQCRMRARRRGQDQDRSTARPCTISSIRSRREMFAEVLNRIVASYRKRPRRLYLILIDPPEVADSCTIAACSSALKLPPVERLKIRLFSPYEVALYRSLA